MIIPKWPVANNIKAVTICRDDKDFSDLSAVALPDKVLWLNQVHGTDSYNVGMYTENKLEILSNSYLKHQLNDISHEYRSSLLAVDASYTTSKNIACAVKTADCLPVLVANHAGTWVSAIHAGWRGLLTGILDKTIRNYNGSPSDLLVWIGPAICQKHFIVGEEVKELFEQSFSAPAFEKAPSSAGLDKWHANLNILAVQALNKIGVNNIFISNYCTYCEPRLFFSYRRDGDKTGRLITLIWNI